MTYPPIYIIHWENNIPTAKAECAPLSLTTNILYIVNANVFEEVIILKDKCVYLKENTVELLDKCRYVSGLEEDVKNAVDIINVLPFSCCSSIISL